MKSLGITILIIFSATQTILLIYLFCYPNLNTPNESTIQQPIETASNPQESTKNLIDLFFKIASNLGIDKIHHRYFNLYGIYLGPLRHKPLNFLEIGLGCTMKYGPGKSLLAWRQFLTHPETRISYIEFNRECAEKFNPPVVHNMFIGDQSDFDFLERVGKEGGPYDVIVDDGGHKRTFQVNSFLGLWPFVKPNGGIYVLEDICFTFTKGFDNSNESAIDMIHKLIMLLNDVNTSGPNVIKVNQTFNPALVEASKTILSINCFYHGCVFVKK